ncbi:unnamed protein product [Penicillium salamii]|nr:unnamed protein product [Penicillium salamii]CAG8420537.1 unnamed protein product [Penicillium salamii]
MVDGICSYHPTISLRICPKEHIASPGMALPKENWTVKHDIHFTVPKITLQEARHTFLTCVLADTIIQYKDVILAFGREWIPESFVFRELAFALISIASNQVKFLSFPAQACDPRAACTQWPWGSCKSNHLPKSPGWLSEEWTGQPTPLLEFGTLSHQPGEPPGASPNDTTYWHEGVAVTLTLVADGEAIVRAAEWGIV